MAKVIRKVSPDGARLKEALTKLDSHNAQVGWFSSARYEDGTPVALVAAANEFGSPKNNVPARPFMRNAVDQNETKWAAIAESGAKNVILGNGSISDTMETIGLVAVGDIKKAIADLHSPPLAASTVRARERKKAAGQPVGNTTKPLIESQTMISTVTHVVERKT